MVSMQLRVHREPNSGRGRFKGESSPAPSRDLTEEHLAESGRETAPVGYARVQRQQGHQRFLTTRKGNLPLRKRSLSPVPLTSLSLLSSRRFGSL